MASVCFLHHILDYNCITSYHHLEHSYTAIWICFWVVSIEPTTVWCIHILCILHHGPGRSNAQWHALMCSRHMHPAFSQMAGFFTLVVLCTLQCVSWCYTVFTVLDASWPITLRMASSVIWVQQASNFLLPSSQAPAVGDSWETQSTKAWMRWCWTLCLSLLLGVRYWIGMISSIGDSPSLMWMSLSSRIWYQIDTLWSLVKVWWSTNVVMSFFLETH